MIDSQGTLTPLLGIGELPLLLVLLTSDCLTDTRSLVVPAALFRCLRLDPVRRPQLDQAILCCPERRVARLYLPCVAL